MYLYFFQVTGSMVAPHRAGRAGPGHPGLSPVTQTGTAAMAVVSWRGWGQGQAVGLSHAQGWGQACCTTAGCSQGRAGIMVQGHGQAEQSG